MSVFFERAMEQKGKRYTRVRASSLVTFSRKPLARQEQSPKRKKGQKKPTEKQRTDHLDEHVKKQEIMRVVRTEESHHRADEHMPTTVASKRLLRE